MLQNIKNLTVIKDQLVTNPLIRMYKSTATIEEVTSQLVRELLDSIETQIGITVQLQSLKLELVMPSRGYLPKRHAQNTTKNKFYIFALTANVSVSVLNVSSMVSIRITM